MVQNNFRFDLEQKVTKETKSLWIDPFVTFVSFCSNRDVHLDQFLCMAELREQPSIDHIESREVDDDTARAICRQLGVQES